MSLTTMNNLAYDVWEPGLNNQLENEVGSLYAFLEKTNKDVRGRNIYLKLKTGRSTGIQNVAEGADFPSAGDPEYDEATITLSRIAATTEWTLDEMELLDGNDAAAVAVVQEKMTDLVDTVRRDVVRQSWGDGSGVLAEVASVGGGGNVEITLASDTDSATATQAERDRHLWIEEDALLLDAVDPTTGAAQESNLAIEDYDPDTNVLTVDQDASTASAGDLLCRAGNIYNNGGTRTSREFAGMLAAVDNDNTYLSIDRTANGKRYWQSNVVTGATAGVLEGISHDRVLKLITKVTRKRGNAPLSKDYCFFSNLGVWNAYGEFLQSGVRYKAMETLDFGWPALQIFGVMYYADIHAPLNNLFLIHKPSFSYRRPKYRKRPLFQFRNDDGTIFRFKTGATNGNYATSVQAHLTGMMSLVTERPNVSGRLDDLEETGSVF